LPKASLKGLLIFYRPLRNISKSRRKKKSSLKKRRRKKMKNKSLDQPLEKHLPLFKLTNPKNQSKFQQTPRDPQQSSMTRTKKR